MSAYGFKKRWEAKLVDGSKETTLRVDRKDGRAPKVGERFSAFIGMRTKSCRRLFDSTISEIHRIIIKAVVGESEFEPLNYAIYRDEVMLTTAQGQAFARADGFEDLDDFISFFEVEHSIDCHEFKGWLIRWKPIR